jgi:hypothetical protein
MIVKQVSVFVENKKGRLAQITKVLSKHCIDIRAISISDTKNFGILRMIVNNPEKAFDALKEEGYTANLTEVLAVDVPDRVGGLNDVLEILDMADISIEYVYSFVRRPCRSPLILFRVDQPEKAIKELKEHNIRIVPKEDLYDL